MSSSSHLKLDGVEKVAPAPERVNSGAAAPERSAGELEELPRPDDKLHSVVRDAAAVPIDSPWPPGRPSPALGPDQVRVWLADLARPPLPAERLTAHLAEEERRRADRFRFEVHRRRFAIGRGLLREMLGRILEVEPAALSFDYGAKGKPSLSLALGSDSAPAGALRFSLSHSRNAVLLAATWNRELGVDVEALRELANAAGLVERFFAPREREVFDSLAASLRTVGFFTGWTRKEAYVKARGDGLSLPTTAFEVDLVPGSAGRLVDFPREPDEIGRWTLIGLEPAAGFLGALAVERSPDRSGRADLEVAPAFWRAD